MKKLMQHPNPNRVVCAILPLCLLLSACSDNTNNTTPGSNRPDPATTDADNSAKNVRDRNAATLTPGDQGSSPADLEVTQKIRKALVIEATGYSTTAKNIKIITTNGKVTLRGPVKTEAEKSGIVMIAKGVAGEGNVEDQLEVEANP
jgi:HSP20 family molecular chaperone IbpA